MRTRGEPTAKDAATDEATATRRTSARSRSSSSKPNYKIDTSGLEIDTEHASDDEFVADEEEQAEADVDETEIKSEGKKEKDEGEEEEYKPNADRGRQNKRKIDKVISNTEGSETDRSRSASTATTPASKKVRMSVPVDNEPIIVRIVNEEYEFPEDPEGETKISKDGDLLDDRKFIVRTFTLVDRGDRKFMLATEPARAVGLRDSHLFFQHHPNLYRYSPSQGQKNDMIERGLIPYSYKSRQIGLVTARSVFREFGAKIIENGEEGVDDYYVTMPRPTRRIVENASRDHPKRLSKRGMEGLDLSAAVIDVNPARNAVEFFDRRSQMYPVNGSTTSSGARLNATNWLYQHAAACSRFNSDMYYDRVRVLLIEQQGLRDPYTNVLHLPQSTQSTKVIGWYKESTSNKKNKDSSSPAVIYETKIQDDDLTRISTGLASVPLEIFDGIVDDEIKQAIIEQQNYERKK
ncbi:hypothetical protein Kpol_1058p57 [Vanderwaltozyma polyspora DSM 70294]|uniref:Chromatin structure-remodeling complex subunit RSC7 n=1 Tax=Vanderwaltozyma polyspora (strain ATCC 22028 / DSM 70294 / BCRC 21397 / CBS 2163 / NBRC 10782 / NRRL Y-8283 / UCD 57-17) TaxID=436907 RepID=A7TJU1_VANPO|nr:uncharacterized protein Kpol_1058p57 [Vanderwaltozyma polyspora DSM 70294]EDO17520.1 hypothetical protein Kpol_1058p57 [Vanderwaltozyma polyspora DSM 70294]